MYLYHNNLLYIHELIQKYYLRPRYLIYKLVQTIFKPSELVRNIKAGLRFQSFLRKGTYGKKRFKNRFDHKEISNNGNEKIKDKTKIDFPSDAPIPRLVPRDYENSNFLD